MKDTLICLYVLLVLSSLFFVCLQTYRDPDRNRLTRMVAAYLGRPRPLQVIEGLKANLVFLMLLFVVLAILDVGLFFDVF